MEKMQITVVPHKYANDTILNKMVEIWKLFYFIVYLH